MATKEFPLSLVIKAVDRATGPLRQISRGIEKFTFPLRKLGTSFRALGNAAGFPRMAGALKGVGSALGKVGGAAVGIGKTLGGLAAVAGFAFVGIVKHAVEAADKLGEMAGRVGLGVDAYASLQHAAGQADIEQEAFNGAMDQFNKRLGEAKAGGGSLLAFLNKVSPALAAQVKGAKSTEEAMGLMTGAFGKLEDPGKRAALAAAAFGNSGLQMGSFLHQGTAEIQKQRDEYLRIAGSQEDTVRSAGALDNAMKKLSAAFSGLMSSGLGPLMPALTELSGAATEFIAQNREGIGKWARETSAAITGWVKGGGIERLIAGFKKFSDTVSPIVAKLGGWPIVLGGVAAAIVGGPLIAALATLSSSFVTLGLAILGTPVGWFLLGAAAIAGAVWLIYDNWGGITEFFSTTFGGVKKLMNGFNEVMLGVLTLDIGRVLAGWGEAVDGFRTSLMSALKLLTLLPGGNLVLGKLAESGALKAVLGSTEPAGPNASFEPPATASFEPAALSSRPRLDANAARPISSVVSSEAKVAVTFDNLPRGARVTTDPNNTANLDTSLGYSMAN